MKNDSIDEKTKSKRIKGRKRGKRIDDSESEEASHEIDNSVKKRKYSKDEVESEDESKINPRKEKQLALQKKLKFIVNEVREKGKYEYNKQEIPENLKYHSDESDSSLSRTLNNKSNKDKSNNKNLGNIELSEKISETKSVKTRKSKKSKEGSIVSSTSSRRRTKINNVDNKNKNTITEFNLDNNPKQMNEEKDKENSVNKKINTINNENISDSKEKNNNKEEEENDINKNEVIKYKKEEDKKSKNLKLKNLLENKKDIL